MISRIFSASITPPVIRISLACMRCKAVSEATAESRPAYSSFDVLELLALVARLGTKPCGCVA